MSRVALVTCLGIGLGIGLGGLASVTACGESVHSRREVQAGEAEWNADQIFESTVAYYRSEPVRGYVSPERRAAPVADVARHRCPGSPDGAAIDSGVTPPFEVRCAHGPDKRCLPGAAAVEGYPLELWRDNPIWSALEFELAGSHRFHYRFVATNDPGGEFGRCQFTVQAFGDLDGDGVFATYERGATLTHGGVQATFERYVDRYE